MKCVKPYILYKAMEQMAKEIAKRQALREYSSLIGIDIFEESLYVAITHDQFDFVADYGCIDKKNLSINKIANKLREIVFVNNVAGFVIGLPDTIHKTNPKVANVKSFVDDLANTGKLKGLKYTYLKDRGGTLSSVALLAEFLDRYKKER